MVVQLQAVKAQNEAMATHVRAVDKQYATLHGQWQLTAAEQSKLKNENAVLRRLLVRTA